MTIQDLAQWLLILIKGGAEWKIGQKEEVELLETVSPGSLVFNPHSGTLFDRRTLLKEKQLKRHKPEEDCRQGKTLAALPPEHLLLFHPLTLEGIRTDVTLKPASLAAVSSLALTQPETGSS